ncbi:MAG: PAS domain S-box protein [Spirochaetota bacterium]
MKLILNTGFIKIFILAAGLTSLAIGCLGLAGWIFNLNILKSFIPGMMAINALLIIITVVILYVNAVQMNKKENEMHDKERMERKQAEKYSNLTKNIMAILNGTENTLEAIRNISVEISNNMGFECVGVRLKDGEDYPYYHTKGFPDLFVKAENYLCAFDPGGTIVRDTMGNAHLECMCGNIICGRTNAGFSFFTKGGSFWTNSTTNLMESAEGKDSKPSLRNRCNAEGYESVALIPLKSMKETIGLLQLNDRRRNMFTSGMIEFFEGVSNIIAFALSRNLAQEELKESELRYRRLFETAKDAIVIIDPVTGNIIDANPIIQEKLGYSNNEVIGKKLCQLDLFNKEYISEYSFSELKRNKYLRFDNIPLMTKDGRVLIVEFISSMYPVHNKEVIHCNIRDITERKQAEEDLRNSEVRYRELFDNISSGVAIYQALDNGNDFIFKDFNKAGEAIDNEQKENLIGRSIHNARLSIKESGLVDVLKRVWETGNPERFPITQYKDNKLSGWYENYVYKLPSGEIIAVSDDFTERKRNEDELLKYHEHLEELVKVRTGELAKERNLLRTLIDNIPDEIYIKDKESRFITTNYHVLRIFGKSNVNDLTGKSDFDLLPYDKAVNYYKDEQEVLNYGKTMNYEEIIRHPDENERWYSILKLPLKDSSGNVSGLIGINRDITPFKIAEQTLKESKELAENANRAKSTFLSNMSHEIRTPLNSILGFCQLMMYDDNLNPEQVESLETINRSGEHLLSIINDILEMSRIEAGQVTLNVSEFDLRKLLSDVEAMFSLKTKTKNLNFEMVYPESLPGTVVADEAKLKQILINLIGNAEKFTNEGGIIVKVNTQGISKNKCVLKIEVEDTGPGIPEYEIGKLFRVFGQTEAGINEGGTGLGLTISRQYALLMGGDITLKSETGKGSCFTIQVNIETGKELQKKKKVRKGRIVKIKPGKNKYKTLITDDKSDNRVLLKKILEPVGFEIQEASNGIEAVEKTKEWTPDIILMDMRMPMMNGYEAIKAIREIKDNNISIIAVTAGAFSEDKKKALNAGANAFLRKPFKEQELFDIIESCLNVKFLYD